MDLFRLIETAPGKHSLLLNAGSTKVDELVEQLGHEPNGYFWEGVAQLLIAAKAPGLIGRIGFDPEGDTFVAYAYGFDGPALEELAALMRPLTTEPDRMRELIAAAEADGFEFDD